MYRGGDSSPITFGPMCGLSNALDGSEDDLVSCDVLPTNADEIKKEEDVGIESDTDELDQFSEDEEEDDES